MCYCKDTCASGPDALRLEILIFGKLETPYIRTPKEVHRFQHLNVTRLYVLILPMLCHFAHLCRSGQTL
jgi:hypothetical protein